MKEFCIFFQLLCILEYVSTIKEINVDNLEKIKEKFLAELNNKLKDDLYNGYTTVGPHRDDINILINGMKAKNFGSKNLIFF